MLLYELALRLGKRSTDLAEEISALTGQPVAPTDSISPQVMEQLRQHYAATHPDFASADPNQALAPPPPPKRSLPKPVRLGIAGLAILGVLGAGASVLAKQVDSEPAERKASSEVASISDQEGFCSSLRTLRDFQRRTHLTEKPSVDQFVGLRDWVEDQGWSLAEAMSTLTEVTEGDLQEDLVVWTAQVEQQRASIVRAGRGDDLFTELQGHYASWGWEEGTLPLPETVSVASAKAC